MGYESTPNQEGQSFESWLAERPNTKAALEAIFDAGQIDGTYEDMVPKVTKPEDMATINNLIADYLSKKEAGDRAGMKATAKEVSKVMEAYF